MSTEIRLGKENGVVTIRTIRHLGQDRFGPYQRSIEGSRFDKVARANLVSIDKVPDILRRLREADFDIEVTPELAKDLQQHSAQQWADVQGATERAEQFNTSLVALGTGLSLYPFQYYGIKWLARKHGALLADDMGLGKGSALDEPVLTPSGWSSYGELRVGSKVIGSSGRATTVTGVFPRGKLDVYLVTLTDGSSTRVDGDHLWHVMTPNDRQRGTHRVLSTRDILLKGVRTHTVSTEKRGLTKGDTAWFVPLVKPIQFFPKVLAVEPYTLGALIANGSMSTRSLSHAGTEEQREQLRKVLPLDSQLRRLPSEQEDCNYALGYASSSLWSALNDLGMWGLLANSKHVPKQYLTGSVEQRLALLQGLMDNDGTCAADGMHAEYNTVSSQLAADVMVLVRSLGGVASMKTRIPHYTYKGERLTGQLDHRISVRLPEGLSPFRVASKVARWSLRQSKYPPAHGIESIEPCGEAEVVCIAVDAPDHLYVTKDYIVTHNTLQCIAALPASPAVLVVCPAVAKGVWRREVAKWRPTLGVTTLEGKGSFRWPKPGEVVVVNYDILPPMHKSDCKNKLCKACAVPVHLKNCECKDKVKDPGCDTTLVGEALLTQAPAEMVMVADEAHNLKSHASQRTRKFRAMSVRVRENTGRVWLLTATPLMNRPDELWSVYAAAGIEREAFGSWDWFLHYFNGSPKYWGGYEWGTPHAEVAERMKRVTLRRMKEDVLQELPPKRWTDLKVDIDKKALREFDKLLKKHGGVQQIIDNMAKGLQFETMSQVRHALALAKIPAALAIAEDYEEQQEPLVVFSAHRAVVEELGKRPGWKTILGGTPNEERTLIEEEFQAGKLKGLAGTITAMGVAITLTKGHNVLFVDREWTPALNAQAEDRCARIGQRNGVLITRLVADHALDVRINELLTEKQRLITSTVDEARDVEVKEGAVEDEVRMMVEAAEEEIRLALLPKETEPVPLAKGKLRFYQPITDQEHWAKSGLLKLVMLDPDFASGENYVGFNKVDTGLGHDLARQLGERNGLSTAQWKLLIKVLKKYHRQVGECPGEEAVNA